MRKQFQQKESKSVVVEARQSFQFFRQITGFLGNSTIKLKKLVLSNCKNITVKVNFRLTTGATRMTCLCHIAKEKIFSKSFSKTVI